MYKTTITMAIFIFLKKVSKTVAALIRQNDMASRYGGEEFAIILPETKLIGGLALAEKLRCSIEQLDIVSDGKLIKTTISVGVLCWNPACQIQNVAQLIDSVDAAMYRAKNAGRNRLCIADLSAFAEPGTQFISGVGRFIPPSSL